MMYNNYGRNKKNILSVLTVVFLSFHIESVTIALFRSSIPPLHFSLTLYPVRKVPSAPLLSAMHNSLVLLSAALHSLRFYGYLG
jgi:hypothetical protein